MNTRFELEEPKNKREWLNKASIQLSDDFEILEIRPSKNKNRPQIKGEFSKGIFWFDLRPEELKKLIEWFGDRPKNWCNKKLYIKSYPFKKDKLRLEISQKPFFQQEKN